MQFVEAFVIARKRGREIETKSVDVHVLHPITQTVSYQLQRARVKQIEGIASAGEIQIERRILRIQSGVRDVVDPAEAQRRAEMIAFGGMIIDYIDNDFDSSRLKTAH